VQLDASRQRRCEIWEEAATAVPEALAPVILVSLGAVAAAVVAAVVAVVAGRERRHRPRRGAALARRAML
jgi:biopolymer transport protein ExbB/TolQ